MTFIEHDDGCFEIQFPDGGTVEVGPEAPFGFGAELYSPEGNLEWCSDYADSPDEALADVRTLCQRAGHELADDVGAALEQFLARRWELACQPED